MPLQTLCRPLAILLVVLLAACAQQQKQTKGTPPLTDEDAQPAPVVSGEPIPKDQVDPDRAASSRGPTSTNGGASSSSSSACASAATARSSP